VNPPEEAVKTIVAAPTLSDGGVLKTLFTGAE
jgi:hypothetical protein